MANFDAKRRAVAARIRELAPNADLLLGMLDETKLDLLLIALTGATLPEPPADDRVNFTKRKD